MLDYLLELYDVYIYELLEYWIPLSMIIAAVVVFIAEAGVGLKAKYGRYSAPNNIGLKAPIAWLLQECPAFFVPLFLIFYHKASLFNGLQQLNTNLIILGYFMIHYFNRSFIYTMRIKSDKKVNVMENFLAFVFCSVNGAQIGHFHTVYVNNSVTDWNFILGSAIFFAGLILNIDSDNRLINLRKSSTGGYKIPYGGLFDYVSAANYSAECFEWFGFALASWSMPGLAFSLFTISNTGPRGYHHHQFYKQKFGKTYPANRKALIPFLL